MAVREHHHARDHAHDGVRLGLAAGANTMFAFVQVAVGLAIGSVVVLADAAHQAVDALGLITAWIALRIARRPANSAWSYGYGKADALGGFVSGLLLLVSVGWIVFESGRRLLQPEPVEGGGVVAIGLVAIVVNGVGVLLVGHGHGDEAMSLRAARLHLLTDLAGSVLVVVAGVVITTTDWEWVDPMYSLLLSGVVLRITWSLVRSATSVLLDRAPSGLDADHLVGALTRQPSVERVHHAHVRSLGRGRHSCSAHVVVDGELTVHQSQMLTAELVAAVERDLRIDHVTLQLECHPCDGLDAGDDC